MLGITFPQPSRSTPLDFEGHLISQHLTAELRPPQETRMFLECASHAPISSTLPTAYSTLNAAALTGDTLIVLYPELTLNSRALIGPEDTHADYALFLELNGFQVDSRWADSMWSDLPRHGTCIGNPRCACTERFVGDKHSLNFQFHRSSAIPTVRHSPRFRSEVVFRRGGLCNTDPSISCTFFCTVNKIL